MLTVLTVLAAMPVKTMLTVLAEIIVLNEDEARDASVHLYSIILIIHESISMLQKHQHHHEHELLFFCWWAA